MAEPDVAALRSENHKLKRHLKELTEAVQTYLVQLDTAMAEPPTPERGRKLGRLVGGLEYANDQARYFGLGIDYRTDRARKERFRKALREKEGLGT